MEAVKIDGRERPADVIEQIIELHEQGYSLRQIGQMTDPPRSGQAVSNALKDLGKATRPMTAYTLPGSLSDAQAAMTGTLPAVLLAARRHAGLSRLKLAEKINYMLARKYRGQVPPDDYMVSKGMIYHYESGYRGEYALTGLRIKQIGDACGCAIIRKRDGTWKFKPVKPS